MENENSDLVEYYKKRAGEYEEIYFKPERQDAIAEAKLILKEVFYNKNVLEVACGTGYWTEVIAAVATTVLATDINEEVINIANAKEYPFTQPVFELADIYHYVPTQKYEAMFAGFIWSHIKLKELPIFIDSLCNMLSSGASVVIMDNFYVEGSNLPVTETDSEGNTYQSRKLRDGTEYKVLKNFPTELDLRNNLAGKLEEIKYIRLNYFWIVTGRVK